MINSQLENRPVDIAEQQLPSSRPVFADFWKMEPSKRAGILLEAIAAVHEHHFLRNAAYRQVITGRGLGEDFEIDALPGLLRQTSQTFKAYIDLLGTPFPQDIPSVFVTWLADQLSIDLPLDRLVAFRQKYRSLEALLKDIERIFHDFGLEILTSSGTSGRASIMVRDQMGINLTVESFYLCFQRYMGMQADHQAIFIMPRDTRIAMARMASFSFRRIGLPEESLHYAIPFPAYPDQVRIRTGRTFRDGVAGLVEHRLWNPLMNWANERVATPRSVSQSIQLLDQAQTEGIKVLLFGGWVHLHAVALALKREQRELRLPSGSLVGTGGGMKEIYPFSTKQIRHDLAGSIKLEDGQPAPVRDVYGMAEGNWAAMQCDQGNYHLPPWIYAVVLDENDCFIETADGTGLLAFYDPVGGGDLFPSFFKTSDRVRLINGSRAYDSNLDCPCGEFGAYLVESSIQRVDLLEEAGCAAQI